MIFFNIINQTRPAGPVIKARYCNSFLSRFRGLMLYKEINPENGLLYNNGNESKINSSIHMLFMRFSITAIWLNKDFQVVDKKLCLPWRIYYAPKKPAQLTIETSTDHFNDFFIGDKILLSKC